MVEKDIPVSFSEIQKQGRELELFAHLKQIALTVHMRVKSSEIIGFKISVCRLGTGSFLYRLKDV